MTAQDTTLPTGDDLRAEIDRLRKERNAVILAHYYQKPEIQDLADYVGDSLQLSQMAAETDADVIAFCGVKFMADTAKILSPEKIVVLPDLDAGCSLEDSCPPDKFRAFREAHPDHIALTYINCSTEVKALSDIIVTSFQRRDHHAARSPKTRRSSSAPTGTSAAIMSRKFNRDMLLWPGVCIVHEAFSETELLKLKAAASRCADRRPSRMPADHRRACRSMWGRPARILAVRPDFRGRHADRRDRAAHHPPDGKGAAREDLHRRARRRRQLQLQHLPLHGAQYAGEALHLRCAISNRG